MDSVGLERSRVSSTLPSIDSNTDCPAPWVHAHIDEEIFYPAFSAAGNAERKKMHFEGSRTCAPPGMTFSPSTNPFRPREANGQRLFDAMFEYADGIEDAAAYDSRSGRAFIDETLAAFLD